MKKIDCIFYLVDNYLYIYSFKNNKLLDYKFNNSIFEGRIIKQNNIIKKVNEVLKKEKISKVLNVQKAYIIYESHLKYLDKKIILDTFEQCGFKDIKLVNTKELVNPSKIYIELNNQYLIVYNKNKYEIIRVNSYFDINKTINLIINQINNSIFVVGINEKIESIVQISDKLFYLENSNRYFIDKIIEKLTMKNKNC